MSGNPCTVPVWRKVMTEAGTAYVAYTEYGLYELLLPGEEEKEYAIVSENDPQWVLQLADDVDNYFAGRAVHFTCPVDYSGYPPFFSRVLAAAAAIPYGESRTYRWLAVQAASPKAVRAAGQAMASNRTPVVIPCHRVLRSDGGLGGFSAGLHWKTRLLALEGTEGGFKHHAD